MPNSVLGQIIYAISPLDFLLCTDTLCCSDHPSIASGQEAGAVQLSPVNPVEGNSTLVLMIPGDRAGLLIGAGGKIRKRIEEETKAKMKIDRSPQACVSAEAKVTISGSEEQCRDAETQVLSVIQNKGMEYTKISTIPAVLDRMIASCCEELQQESKDKGEVKQAHDERQCRTTGAPSQVEHTEGLGAHAMPLVPWEQR